MADLTLKVSSLVAKAVAPISQQVVENVGGTLVAQIQDLDQKMGRQKGALLLEVQYTNNRTDDLAKDQEDFKRAQKARVGPCCNADGYSDSVAEATAV